MKATLAASVGEASCLEDEDDILGGQLSSSKNDGCKTTD